MNVIELSNVCIDYPLDSEDGYSVKNTILNFYAKAKIPKSEYFRALNNVSLTVSNGEKLGIVGLNGAGKSTILKVMSGIFLPTQGEVTINRAVSPILDFATGFEHQLTGIESVKMRLMFLGLSNREIKAKIPEIIEFSELGDFVYQPIKTYSSGMFIRLAFATSTAIDPEILIIDEVIGAGDAQFTIKAKNRLEHFLSQNCTVILSSHSMDILRNFCNRVIWLHKGQVIADGTTNDIINDYEQNAHDMLL